MVTSPNDYYDVQIYIEDTFYYREALLNVIARKFDDWEFMTWIDAHQTFENPYWWEETIYKL